MSSPPFQVSSELLDLWAKFTEKSEEKFFRQFVRGLLSRWESEVSPNWEDLVTAWLGGKRQRGPALSELPDELLPALSKFLFIGKDECEQDGLNVKSIEKCKDLVKVLLILTRNEENIPLIASLEFVSLLTQMVSVLLEALLEMESTFFAKKVKAEMVKQKLRDEILDFIAQSCHFLEGIYDPFFRWRVFLLGKLQDQQQEDFLPPTSVALHQETIPFLYESFETALADCFPQLARHMLTVFGAIMSGARHNATRAISPATTKMILKTVRDVDGTADEVHISAIYVSAKSIQILHDTNMEERQLDLNVLIEQYQQILTSLSCKDGVSLATLLEGVSMMSKMLRVKNSEDLQKTLAKAGMIQTLLQLMSECHLDTDAKRTLLPIVIHRLSLLLQNCEVACQKMNRLDGYRQLFDIVNSLGSPDTNALQAILAIATHAKEDSEQAMSATRISKSVKIRTIEPVLYLFKWITETEYDNQEQQIWLTESLLLLCSANVQNKTLCCQAGVVLELVKVLRHHDKLHAKSAVAVLRLIEALGSHSITPFELKQLIKLLQPELKEDCSTPTQAFPFKSHVIHVISSMAKNDGFDTCRQYFEIGLEVEGLSVPSIREWPGPSTGFTFHAWVRLDPFPESPEHQGERRRQLYSFYTASGNGFEAFFTNEGTLVVAVANKKEYLAVPLSEHPVIINDCRWHCLVICHAAGKRPFGASSLTIFVDGAKRLECSLKWPSLNGEPFSYCQVGAPLQRGNIPALNAEALGGKQSFKDGLMDAIKLGIPGVINLPGSKGNNDPHVKWTLIGLEDQLWGRPMSLIGQIGGITCLSDVVSSTQAKLLHNLGPNQFFSFSGGREEDPEVVDLMSKLVFYFSPRAASYNSCPNLVDPTRFEATVMAKAFSNQDVKDVINCIGGVHVLFPLLETAASLPEAEQAFDIGYLSLRSVEDQSRRPSVEDVGGAEGGAANSDWELLPSSSFSDWKLEQNSISGFLTLVKNLVTNHTINTEQLMRGGGVSIIGALLLKAKPKLIDVNVLMAAQLLVELTHAAKDQKLLVQFYHHVLFDFRIWSKSEFHVQIGHIQYISTIIKDDRKYFRKKFGVQFFLDVIRKHYSPVECSPVLSKEDCRTLRASLFGLIKYYITRDVSSKEAYPIVAFILSEKSDVLVREMVEVLSQYLDNKQSKDQMHLILYESRKADLLYCLLLQLNANGEKKSSSWRRSILKLITTLLRTNRVSLRHKYRMHLVEVRYLGFLHLWFKRGSVMALSPTVEETPLEASFNHSQEEILILLDQMMLFDDSSSVQGILGLCHHLQWAPLQIKLEVARRIMSYLFSKPEVPASFSKQIGWQDCLTKLFVKKILKPELETSFSSMSMEETAGESSESPSHYIDRATTTAKAYLPTPAGEAVGFIGSVANRATKKVTDNVYYAKDLATEKVSNTVLMTQEMVTSAQEKVSTNVASKTQQLLGKIEDLSYKRRRNSTASINSAADGVDGAHGSPRAQTPQYLQSFLVNHLSPFDDMSMTAVSDIAKSPSTSSEDLSISRAETTCSTPTRNLAVDRVDAGSIGGGDPAYIPDMEMVAEDLSGEIARAMGLSSRAMEDGEEELCQLVINILFTVMWRGLSGASEGAIKERGQVIACINMLGLNNDLYRSHVDLKRRLVEQCIQAVLSDFADKSRGTAAPADSQAVAEHVMQWVYDLIVLDPYGNFNKKVTEPLLDGILALVESLTVFSDAGEASHEWCVMAKMALNILLKCAESSDDVEICTMATAKLHALVQTRSSSQVEENAYLIQRVSKIILKVIDSEQYSFIVPVMKALLEKSKEQMSLNTQLPSLNLRQASPTFFEEFKAYIHTEEWKYFLLKKVTPLSDAFQAGFLVSLPLNMDTFWAECFELSKIASHKRSRDVGESKLAFVAKYMEPFQAVVRGELVRFNHNESQQQSHLAFIIKRWDVSKRLFFGSRGAWSAGEPDEDRWRLAINENFLRMRLKMVPNASFDSHAAASAARDNSSRSSSSAAASAMDLPSISKDAVVHGAEGQMHDDGLTEEELKSMAKEQMETADETAKLVDHASERLIMSEDCEIVTLMSVVKGKFELTTNFVYFFDSSPYKENEDRHDFRWPLFQLREVHLRRFNLRRSGMEFFLLDQTNYFLNFSDKRRRNKVFSRISGLRLPNLIHSSGSSRSPAEVLKASELTQKWVQREISNFEYLMHLNTIAGRTFNDLSQYPVFPWVLADYETEKLDLTDPKSFRDLSKPIGVQNDKHAEEVRAKYENFEDPSGVISKFHYGTHYSNSAMVLHYLVRLEPFTSLHIELQSGRFDVADRQFHSIPQTWKNVYGNVNDVKELIPEFFYLPEFLQNGNDFDLGRLQGKSKRRVDNVELPKWARNPDDFIRKHRMALECEHVSSNLNHWIDLIFGSKQKGKAAEEALNVFYYCSYEGAVNLDAIEDPAEREAVEGMINNFGQTPCQLLKEPHPKRMSLEEYKKVRSVAKPGACRPDLFQFFTHWSPLRIDMANDKDPVVFIRLPRSQQMLPGISTWNSPEPLVTLTQSCMLGVHSWLPYDPKGQNPFTLDRDPTTLEMPVGSKHQAHKKRLPPPLTPGLNVGRKLFCVSPDGKWLFSGGHWDNSLQVVNVPKVKTVSRVVRHIDVITCLCIDATGNFVMSGSRDTTSIIWEIFGLHSSVATIATDSPQPRPVQVLSGHDRAVSCVALSTELDVAVSGSDDGSVNVYTAKDGQYIRSICPPSFGGVGFRVQQLSLSYAGHVVFSGHSREVHSLHVYTINGHLLTSSSVQHRITALHVTPDFVLSGDENGDLVLRDLLTPKVVQTLSLQLPIQDVCLTSGNTHMLAPLRDGALIVVALPVPKVN